MMRQLYLILFCVLFVCGFSALSSAQESYAPPPMFGNAPAAKPVEPAAKPAPVMPGSEALLGEETKPTPPVKNDPRPPIILPEAERSKPIIEPVKPKISKPKPVPKPIPKPKKETKVSKKPAPKMPAVPAKVVEQEILPEIVKLPPAANVDDVSKIQDKALEQKMVTPNPEAILNQIEEAAPKKSNLFVNENAVTTLPKTESIKTQLEKISLNFKPNLSEISSELNGILLSDILPKLIENKTIRVQLQAYASAPEDGGQSAARRISLARALSVRGWLIEKGIAADRMDVRALGMNTNQEPLDRVDLVFIDQP